MKKLLFISSLLLSLMWIQAQTESQVVFKTVKNTNVVFDTPVRKTASCNPPTNLTAEHIANGNKLNWILPANANTLNTEVLRYCTDNLDEGVGLLGSYTYNAAISFPADVMANYAGRTITSIKVALDKTAFELRDQSVWIRNSLSGANLASKVAKFKAGILQIKRKIRNVRRVII